MGDQVPRFFVWVSDRIFEYGLSPGTKVELKVELTAYDPGSKQNWILVKGEVCTAVEENMIKFEGREVVRYALEYCSPYFDIYMEGIPKEFLTLSLPHRAPEA